MLVLSALAVPMAIGAQEGPITLEFSLSNPGARSMGLGGAFAALADDATAAFANPAGLVQLIEPEFSIEGRFTSVDTEFVEGGRAVGEPTGFGIDTIAGVRTGVSTNESSDASFASLVFPARRAAVALYRHVWADFDLTRRVDGLFGDVEGELDRSEDVLARTRVRVVHTGLALALEVTDRFSIGIAAVSFDADMDSRSVEYGQEDDGFFEPNPFTPELVDTLYSYRSTTSDWVGHVGILLRPSDRWSLGAYYREGPTLELRVVETVGPADDEVPAGTIELDTTTPLELPDVYGVGIAVHSADGRWTTSVEWAHVRYSAIVRSLDTAVFDPDQIAIEDGSELHFGIERILSRARPIVGLRLGAWLDPDHRVGSGFDADVFESAIFRAGDDLWHGTGGLGLVFESFQLDFGFDLSERGHTASISVVYRF